MSTEQESSAEASTYEVLLAPRAERDLDRLTGADFKRVDRRILSLGTNPRPSGTRKIGNDLYRTRVGSWRIIYVIDDAEKKVVVSRIKRREKDTYRTGL